MTFIYSHIICVKNDYSYYYYYYNNYYYYYYKGVNKNALVS